MNTLYITGSYSIAQRYVSTGTNPYFTEQYSDYFTDMSQSMCHCNDPVLTVYIAIHITQWAQKSIRRRLPALFPWQAFWYVYTCPE